MDAGVEFAHGFAVGLRDGGGGELVGGAVGGEEIEGEDAGAGDVDGFGVGETADLEGVVVVVAGDGVESSGNSVKRLGLRWESE